MSQSEHLWYKDAIIYEVHVRAFSDSDRDGYGDFGGLTDKLDYLQDLGITAVWLLPFYPSPLKDDGYDIAAHTSIHSQYGKLDDFKVFLEAAHERGIKVITELVVNHTSDQHPWFQRARRAPPGSPHRDFYVWSDSPEKYKDARVIFKDFEPSNWTWDPVAKAYYWHRFYSHQPDLNFDNPAVWEAILPIVDFWFKLGVDGMRLDAVPYLYEREGTNCENLPETHDFLRALRRFLDERYADRMLLAEANQWPEDAVAYFGQGDECHMAFHFPLMPRLFMAVHQEDRFPIHDIMAQTPAVPDVCQWCLFLRNHDELTLEMVTDEERDYMYRAYALDRHARINLGIRHRLAPLLQDDRRRIELMYGLLFSLPGTPVIYYGDEIGMGDNIYLGDRNGVRTPMQWSADRNAGFSRANPQKLYLPVIIDPEYHYETVNVEAQQGNHSSLLWWVKRLIALRKRYRAFGRGSLELLRPENSKVLAFIREFEDNRILIVANLSRFIQSVQLDLTEYAGVVPEELLGGTAFPQITDQPYSLTLGPHMFIWFSLPVAPAPEVGPGGALPDESDLELPLLPGSRALAKRFQASLWEELEALLPQYLRRRRLVASHEVLSSARIQNVAPVKVGDGDIWFVLVRVEPRGEMPRVLSLGLSFVHDSQVDELMMPPSAAALARVSEPENGLLCDALAVPACCQGFLRGILAGRLRRVEGGEIESASLPGLGVTDPLAAADLPLSLRHGKRSNTTVVYGDAFVLKTFCRIEEGVNPDLEIGRHLAEQSGYQGAAPVVGYVEYRRRGAEPVTLGVLHRYVPNQGNGWQYMLDQLSHYFERVAALSHERLLRPPPSTPPLDGANEDESQDWRELLGGQQETARLLGQHTAELHQAMAAAGSDATLAPEYFGKLYQRSLYQSLRNLTGRLCYRLAREVCDLPESARPLAERIVREHDVILQRFKAVLDPSMSSGRIRCHGNYTLEQLLFTGKNFVIMDCEGETNRTIGERRVKRSPLWDVASMIHSLDSAVQSVFLGLTDSRGRPPGMIRTEDRRALEPWAGAWFDQFVGTYVLTYTKQIQPANLLPQSPVSRAKFLGLLLLEKALLEVDQDLSEDIQRAVIPLRSASRLLDRDWAEPGDLQEG
jgi:maltose alpha-D-glucosyltransferase/alpha-amylase